MAAVFNPSPVVKSFGSGILAINACMYPVGSNPGRNGSRPKTLNEVRGPVAPRGVTGLPYTSTVGLLEIAFPPCTPGKYRKITWRARAVRTAPEPYSRVAPGLPSAG